MGDPSGDRIKAMKSLPSCYCSCPWDFAYWYQGIHGLSEALRPRQTDPRVLLAGSQGPRGGPRPQIISEETEVTFQEASHRMASLPLSISGIPFLGFYTIEIQIHMHRNIHMYKDGQCRMCCNGENLGITTFPNRNGWIKCTLSILWLNKVYSIHTMKYY